MAAEAAIAVTDLAMKVCGGAAFRKELGIERHFRDARAARVMAPDHRRPARLRRPGHLRPAAARRWHEPTCFVIGAVAYDPKVVTIWDGFRAWFRDQGLDFDYVLYSNYERQVEDLVAGHIHVAWNSPLAWVRPDGWAARASASSPDHARHRLRPHVGRGGARRLRHRVGGRPRRAHASASAPSTRRRPRCSRSPTSRAAGAGRRLRGAALRRRGRPARRPRRRRARRGPGADGRRRRRRLHDRRQPPGVRQGGHAARRVDPGADPDRPLRPLQHDGASTTAPARAWLARFGQLLLSMSYADPVVRPLLDLEGLKRVGAGPDQRATPRSRGRRRARASTTPRAT